MGLSLRRQLVNLLYDTPLESTARHIYEYVFERTNYEDNRQMSEILQRVLAPDSVCVDVGCYRGKFLRQMMRLAPMGRVFAFEPAPYHHDYLRKRFPEAQIFPVALGQTAGMATFYFDEQYPARSRLAASGSARPSHKTREVTVCVDTLDNVLPQDLIVDLIKIDVEGAEYDVIRGGESTIRKSRPVVLFEHGPGGPRNGQCPSCSLHELLTQDMGLRVFTLAGWLAHEPPMDVHAFVECVVGGRCWNFVAAE
jgi:FkbM family methyltransferase